MTVTYHLAERAIKPLVIGQKIWSFSNTSNVTNASAILYSIVEAVKANGLGILYECMQMLTKPELGINALLPWNFQH